MIGYIKNQHVYIRVPKNGSTTFRTLCERAGWKEFNLFDNNINLSQCVLWGHITEPEARHTKGLSTHLTDNPDFLERFMGNDPLFERMLVTGVFDAHTYSLHMTLGPLISLPIHWIPLDATITKWNPYPQAPEVLDGNALTNDFFREQGIDLHVTKKDIFYVNREKHKEVREKINYLKKLYHEPYQQLVKHFLEPDQILYTKVLKHFTEKYGG
jgi:hypothetical protein